MAAAVTERELEVARILQQLPSLLRDADLHAFPSRWGGKRRRSAHARQNAPRPFPPPPPEPGAPVALPPVSVQRKKAGDGTAAKEEETDATSSPVSPLPPFCFDQNGEETDQQPTRGVARPSKKVKAPVQHKDWLREQNLHISRLQETNRNLEQQAAYYRMRHEFLLAENSRLKELKSNDHGHQKCGVLPAGPKELPKSETYQKAAAEHSRPPQSDPVHHRPGIVSPWFPTSGGTYHCGPDGDRRLPDLNTAICHEDHAPPPPPPPPPKKQRHHQVAVIVEQCQYQRALWDESFEKRMVTAEARKRRIEIKRRKASAAATMSSAAAAAV